MMPILYSPDTTVFDTNGIGVLADATSCTHTAAVNGQYELELTYPTTGAFFYEIKLRSIICASAGPGSEIQPFRVYHISKPHQGVVTYSARHILYDCKMIVCAPFSAPTLPSALLEMKSAAATDCPFTFETVIDAIMALENPAMLIAEYGNDKGSMDADTEVRGYLLYNQLATEASRTADVELQEKYAKQAIDVLTDITNMVRENARAVQAVRILKKMAPEGKYYSLERAVKNLNDKLLKDMAGFELEKGRKTLEINKELAWAWMHALHTGDQIRAAEAEEALYKDLASQVKRTFWDRWNAWRYLSMLGNFKTLIRNFAGNLAMAPAKYTKDKIAAGLETVFVRDKSKRTKFIGPTHTKRGEALRTFAKRDYALVSELLGDAGKYNDQVNTKLLQAIREYKSKFKFVGLKQYQAAVDWVMNGKVLGDSMFMKKHYTASFATIAMARGWTAEQIKSGRISQTALDEARSIAFREAQKATFRDVNALSGAVRKWRFTGNKIGPRAAKFGNIWLDATLPFRATPANVLVRAVEYSPLELVYNMIFGTADVVKGKISASDYIDHWATGLTGTGVWGLGMLLAGLGLINGGNVDDDDEREGYQQYGLQIGDKTYSLDWLSPMAIPLFMGVESYGFVVEPLLEGENLDLGGALTAIGKAFQPMLEMSCLSGITSMLDTMTYTGEADAWQLMYAVFISPFISYVGQAIPTLSSQTAATFEKNGEKTYVSDIENQAARNITYDLVKLLEKLPAADWRQVPRVDAWGRVDKGNGWAESFLSPAYVSDISVTEADREIERLKTVFQEQIDELKVKYSKTTTQAEKADIRKKITRLGELMDVSPDLAGTKIGDVRLTQEEYTAYALAKGQNNFELASAMIGSDWYKGLSDEQKSDALRKTYDLADARGKASAVGFVKSDWTKNLLDCDTKTAVAGIQSKLEESWAESAKESANAELKAVILSGGNASSAIKRLVELGKSEDEIKSDAKRYITEMFKAGEISDTNAQQSRDD